MKHFLKLTIGFCSLLCILVSAQSAPKNLKVNLNESRINHNTVISPDSKYIYLLGTVKDVTQTDGTTKTICPIDLWNLDTGKIQKSIHFHEQG